jgi:hypothetical protein
MEIRIDGKAADITLESEETLGEILLGFENWIAGSGLRISGLVIDGELIDSGGLSAAFTRNLREIREIDIRTSTRQDLLLEALRDARSYLGAFDSSPGAAAQENWEESAAAHFLTDEYPELARIVGEIFKQEGPAPERIYPLIDERIREAADPRGELSRIGPPVSDLIRRLEDLPLDIQTGKDRRAAETVSLFSGIAEKMFRLFFLLQNPGEEIPLIDSLPASNFLEEFNAALRELLAAYEAKDAVLIGDLAEYELAPRLQTFYQSMNYQL